MSPFDGTPALNHVYHCDALDLLKALPDGSVDMCLTSPPYDSLRAYKGYAWDFEGIARDSYRVLKPGGVLVWVVGDATVNGSETLTSMRQALYFVDVCGFRMHDTMIWQKDKGGSPNSAQNPTRYPACFEYMLVFSKDAPKTVNLQVEANRHAGEKKKSSQRQRNGVAVDYSGEYTVSSHSPMGNVWYMPAGWMKSTPDAIAYEHPATFPETLAERHILTWTNPGDLVLDYFGGSGTTAKMARANGRNYLTCDISEDYCELMRRRLALPFTVPMFETLAEVAE